MLVFDPTPGHKLDLEKDHGVQAKNKIFYIYLI